MQQSDCLKLAIFLCLCWFSLWTNGRGFRSPVHRVGRLTSDWGAEAANRGAPSLCESLKEVGNDWQVACTLSLNHSLMLYHHQSPLTVSHKLWLGPFLFSHNFEWGHWYLGKKNGDITWRRSPLKDSPSKTAKAGSFRGCRPWTETQQPLQWCGHVCPASTQLMSSEKQEVEEEEATTASWMDHTLSDLWMKTTFHWR